MSSCKNLPHGALLAQSMKSYSSFMDLSCVQESHVNNEKTGRTRPPELNLVARARRGRVSISSSSRGKPIKVGISSFVCLLYSTHPLQANAFMCDPRKFDEE